MRATSFQLRHFCKFLKKSPCKVIDLCVDANDSNLRIALSSPGGYDIAMTTKATHQSHTDIVKRIKRADGHLRTIIEMIEAGRSCLDIAQQLQAVEKAICTAKKALIHDHIDHCLDVAVGPTSRSQRAPIEAFKDITKYL